MKTALSLKQYVRFALLFCTAWCGPASAGNAQIPLDHEAQAAADLLYEGKLLDPDRALSLSEAGTDLSVLDPLPNDIWGGEGIPEDRPLSPSVKGMRFKEVELAQELPKGEGTTGAIVLSAIREDTGERVNLILSTGVHASLLRHSFLKRMGYHMPDARWVERAELGFRSECAFEGIAETLTDSQIGVDSALWFDRSGLPKRDATAPCDDTRAVSIPTVDLFMESASSGLQPVHSMIDAKSFGLREHRALRALLLPYVLFDVTESVNMFSVESAKILAGHAVLYHRYADQFSNNETRVSLADMRWAIRKLGPLSRADWRAALEEARYPATIAEVLLEKLLARRNGLVQVFGLEKEFPSIPFNLKINNKDVKQGKVTQGEFDGYTVRFSYKNRESPLRFWEVMRYLGIEGIQYVSQRAQEWLNGSLQLQDAKGVFTKHLKENMGKLKAHFEKYKGDPNHPFKLPIAVWGGPTAGLNTQFGRSVLTGSYYGSSSKVQLVDTLALSASVGLVGGVDSLVKNMTISGGAQLSVTRSYSHIQPVFEMKDAYKADWTALNVPGFLSSLGAVLEQNAKDGSALPDEVRLKRLLGTLKENELFLITDSLNLTPRISAGLALEPITGLELAPIGISPSVSIGVSAPQAILRRTTILRTSKGLQVYLQRANTHALEVSFDFNYFINLFRYSRSNKLGEGASKAFLFDLSFAETAVDPDEKNGDATEIPPTEAPAGMDLPKIRKALKALIASNDSEMLEKEFPSFELRHKTEFQSERWKFLRWQGSATEEKHLLRVKPPADPEHGVKPSEHERTLYSNVLQWMDGTNDLGFLSDLMSVASPGDAPKLSGGTDPADTFFGKSRTHIVRTEAEITPHTPFAPVTTIERHWRGAELSKKKVFFLFDELDGKLASLPGGASPETLRLARVNREAFSDMRSLQLYDLSTTLLLYPAAIAEGERALFEGSAKSAADWLIGIAGKSEHEAWCSSMRMLLPVGSSVPLSAAVDTYSEGGESIPCLKPWMNRILRLRKSKPADLRAQVDRANRWLAAFEENVPFARLVKKLGEKNLFFRLNVNGFRTQDENGDQSTYTSHSIGLFQDQGGGAFQDLISRFELLSHEVYGRYLSEGF